MVAAVEIDELETVETLIEAGYLAARNAEDRAAIEAALSELLAALVALDQDEGE
ncbi:hypothetical protein [Prosthecomicrobium pneumaticum]|uniref:Uncharacterized protein n=1 Tax=Prosthecomicrobium pneumaticum TaxID=81895 RepID=A0A7W9L3A9_9HYPH|nr:hypothetical protein [Prosthecomicrobium pneumaticum]MBB5754340.1 hypothetical protein [Prosthecomicrobium pneumaticum]